MISDVVEELPRGQNTEHLLPVAGSTCTECQYSMHTSPSTRTDGYDDPRYLYCITGTGTVVFVSVLHTRRACCPRKKVVSKFPRFERNYTEGLPYIFLYFYLHKKNCICKCFSHLRPLRKTALSETEMT